MARWIPKDLRLTNNHVELTPLTTEHEAELVDAAQDGELWNLNVTQVPSAETVTKYIRDALNAKENQTQHPFVVRKCKDRNVIGCTRYYDIQESHKNLSIGYTWYAQSVQRTAVNTACKYLLLRYAFEILDCIGVTFHTDGLNYQSQAAILRLGAKKEGVLRNHRIMPDGRIRDTWCYSIIRDEWPSIADNLVTRLDAN